ncbi:hypothetical protein [Arthrobacter sp. BE255]|uniref:hypothetical protein n=1 Tax=Arthrobacter sp. BE255 TaxID=2817721 RepID=UPI00285D7D11|nr:hypothetical protein [Arthrobacter sp. BE255]MDR7160066.1 septal ring-binding cell division protein DamX [Arthrobacter sp. BE255]
MTLFQTRRRWFETRRLIRLATVLALATLLAGCGPAETGLQRDAARQLQEQVLGVSQAAAANDPAAALKALESLEAGLASAAGSGQVSEDRRRGIMTSVAAVRADLTAAVEAAAAKAAEEAAAAAAAAEAEKARAEAEASAQAAAESAAAAAPAPAPAQAPAPAPAKGSEGKGKGKNG